MSDDTKERVYYYGKLAAVALMLACACISTICSLLVTRSLRQIDSNTAISAQNRLAATILKGDINTLRAAMVSKDQLTQALDPIKFDVAKIRERTARIETGLQIKGIIPPAAMEMHE